MPTSVVFVRVRERSVWKALDASTHNRRFCDLPNSIALGIEDLDPGARLQDPYPIPESNFPA